MAAGRPRPGRTLRPLRTSYQLGARLTRAVPPGLRYPLAGFGGALWWAADAGRRRNAYDNYAAVLGLPPEHPEVRRVARHAFENYGRMLSDFLLMGSLRPDEVIEAVTLEGREHAEAALATGRGAIVALPHMGSWDLAAALAGILGYRIGAVAERFPGSLNDAVVESRSRHGLRVIPMGRPAVRAINEVLDGGGMVALLCDLPQGPGSEVCFFGRRAVVPSGPAAIACRRGVPLLPVYCRWDGGGRHVIHVDPPVEPPAAGACRDRQAVADAMQRVVARFEGFIRARPDQWYAFRRILH